MEFPPDSQETSDLPLDQLTLPPIRTSTNTPQEQSSPDPLPSSPRAESGSDSLRLSPTPDHSSIHNPVTGNQNQTMAVRQISDTTLPSFSQVFGNFGGHEAQAVAYERDDGHHARSLTLLGAERSHNEKRKSDYEYNDDVAQQQRDRYQSASNRSPMTANYGYDSANASPVSSTPRRSSSRSAVNPRVFPTYDNPYVSRHHQEQSILPISEGRAAYPDHHISRSPYHSPISEPPSSTYHSNLPCITPIDRTPYRTWPQNPVGRSYNDYPPPGAEYPRSEYALEARPLHTHDNVARDEPYPYPFYGYQQPRDQPYAGPSSYPPNQGQTPFTNGHPAGNYSPNSHQSEDMGDGKPRKRRGNLPKPTTDILTDWFVNHLEHPYPNEEEKQYLMRQTGLQLNQISNWFINARRRKLPALQNSARAENAARSHHNRMHSGDDGQSPMHQGTSERGVSPGSTGTYPEGWSAHPGERHTDQHY